MRVCDYLNQRVTRISKKNGKSFKGVSKTKKKKKHMKRSSFKTQIEFLLPFTGCRKVLGKMPEGDIKSLCPLCLGITANCKEWMKHL